MRRTWTRTLLRTRGAVLALPVVLAGWLAWQITAFMTDDDPFAARQSVPCSEAMLHAGQDGMPTGAYDATCRARVWTDTTYDVKFRITRANLDAWLASAYPGTELSSGCYPDTVDACAGIQLESPAKGGAAAIDMDVEYEGVSTVLVHLELFDV